jgi:hypothetical protein
MTASKQSQVGTAEHLQTDSSWNRLGGYFKRYVEDSIIEMNKGNQVCVLFVLLTYSICCTMHGPGNVNVSTQHPFTLLFKDTPDAVSRALLFLYPRR